MQYAPETMVYYGVLSIWGPYRELFFLGWDILRIPRAFHPFFHQNWDCHPQSRWRRSGVAPGWAAIKIIKARVSDAWVNSGSRPLWYTFSVGQDQASYTILIRNSLVPQVRITEERFIPVVWAIYIYTYIYTYLPTMKIQRQFQKLRLSQRPCHI